jgi:hypothetical protein
MIKDMSAVGIMTSVGALGGIVYGMNRSKSFFTVAGFCLLFAVTGAAIGTGYETLKQ